MNDSFLVRLYRRYVLPKFLDSGMSKKEIDAQRSATVGKASGTALEVGFGSGLNLPHYRNIAKLYALDPSPEMLALAEPRMRDAAFPIETIIASAEHIPLADNSVDSALSTWTFCSIPDPIAALKEVRRVLKPEGVFAFNEHGASPKRFIALLQTTWTPASRLYAGGCHLNRRIDALIAEAGFDIRELKTYQEPGHPLIFNYEGLAVPTKTR